MKHFVIAAVCSAAALSGSFMMYNNAVAQLNELAAPKELNSGAVYPYVRKGAVMLDSIDGKAVCFIPSGQRVELLKDRGCEWYYVRYNNRMGWVKEEMLLFPDEVPTNPHQLERNYIVEFANRHFTTDSSHFVWVDIDRQRIYILKKTGDSFDLERTIICATGKNQSPTTRGFFKIKDRGTMFYSNRLGSGAKYWVRFNGSYLFHSVATDEKGRIIDNVLGERRSSGCVRMSMEDAAWFYKNIEENSGVWIY